MSDVLGPDGKKAVSEKENKTYMAGGLRFSTALAPDELISKALAGAKHVIGSGAYEKSMRMVQNHAIAQAEADQAAANVSDPFTMEPAAMAVFMYLCREIEYRDKVFAEISESLERLGSDPISTTHPYPAPEKKDEPSGKGD